MKLCSLPPLALATLLAAFPLAAREWRSADGKKTIDATFVDLQGERLVLSSNGRPTHFPLTAFSADDQQFAKVAQDIADAAEKLGPQSLEFSHPAEDGSGWICRLALHSDPKAPAKLYTGETIFVVTPNVSKYSKSQHLDNQLLHGTGGRTYHPLQGAPSPIRAFALDAETATVSWGLVFANSGGDPTKQSPNVIEPDVEIVKSIGFGVVIGKGGLVGISPDLVKGVDTLVIHHDGTDYPATVLQAKDKSGVDMVEYGKLGLGLVTCGVPLEPARIGTKKVLDVGQEIFALSCELNSSKKNFASRPAVTRGIVSRLGTRADTFQHDARLPPECPGGFVIGGKGDVYGFFFQPQTTGRAAPSRQSPAANAAGIDTLGTCISTQAVSALLDKTSGQTSLRSVISPNDMEETGKTLLKSCVLVIATSEVNKPRKISLAKSSAPTPPGGAAPPTGWSLSKSGVRHHSKCQHYNAQNPCQSTDGRPCKVCGG